MDKPNYPYWDRQQEIARMDAACLCLDFEPENLTKDHPAYWRHLAMLRRLDAEVPAIRRGGGGRYSWSETTFRYDALRQWAEDTDQRAAMPFLFSEDRTAESLADVPENPPIAPRIPTDNSLLMTIAALLSVMKKPYPTGKDLEKAAQSIGLSISDDTIRTALKAAKAIAPSLPDLPNPPN